MTYLVHVAAHKLGVYRLRVVCHPKSLLGGNKFINKPNFPADDAAKQNRVASLTTAELPQSCDFVWNFSRPCREFVHILFTNHPSVHVSRDGAYKQRVSTGIRLSDGKRCSGTSTKRLLTQFSSIQFYLNCDRSLFREKKIKLSEKINCSRLSAA